MSDSPLRDAAIVVLLLFFTTILVGWIGAAANPAVGTSLLKLFEQEVAGQMNVGDPVSLAVTLFFNNLQACILLFLGGASFGIITIFIMSLNGIVIGAIMEIVRQDHSPLFVAAALLPHGIFEIPAFILSGSLGILLAQSLITEWYGSGDASDTARGFARIFLAYVLPLVALAAVVEAFITPVVIHLVA